MEQPLLTSEPNEYCKENKINETKSIIYLPAYSAFIVKTLTGLDPALGTLSMDYTLCLWVGVAGLEESAINDIDSNFKLRINEQDFKMDNDYVKRSRVKNKEGHVTFLSYVIRKEVETLYLGEDFLYTPFDTLILNTKVELTSYQSKVIGKHIRYFFHQYKDKDTKLLFKDEVDRLPEFNVAYNMTDIILSAEKKNDEKLYYYPITIFRFSVYRQPGKAILQAFLPMFILSFFVIASMIGFGLTLSEQLPNLATIFLAYVAFIPTVKSSIPSVAYATFTDYTIYAYLFSTLTAMGHVVLKEYELGSAYTFHLFMTITCILIFTPMILTAFFLFRYKINKKGYDQKYIRKEKESSVGFQTNGWFNEQWAKQPLPE